MYSNKIKKLISYADNQLSIYFPAVRKAVLLIVIPAFIVVIAYLVNITAEVVTGNDDLTVLDYEKRLAGVKSELSPDAVVNYVTDSHLQDDLINTAYVLIPVRVVAGKKPKQDYLIYQSFTGVRKTEFKGYTLKKNYGNGVMLFKRNR